MIYYILLTAAALLFALQFMFNNGYQKECGTGMSVSLRFGLYNSLFGFLIMFFINKCHFEFSWFSFAISVVYGFVCVAYNYFSIKAFETANLSIYSIFAMIGGMLLPFAYGLVSGEALLILRTFSCVVIVLAIIMTAKTGDKGSKGAIKYYIGVFILNGLVGVLSAFHQGFTFLDPGYVAPENSGFVIANFHTFFANVTGMTKNLAVDNGSFIMLNRLTTAVYSFVLLMFQKDKSLKISAKASAYCIGNSAFNNIANLFILIALTGNRVPASVTYPIITGGVIVFSTLIDKVRKVNVPVKVLIATAITLVASVAMAFEM